MGSTVTTVGNRAGKLVATLNAASQDTGVILSVFPVAGVPGSGDLPMGYKNVIFQLVLGNMTAGTVTVFGTLDALTANGTLTGDDANWEPLVAPSTEAAYQWSNPLSAQAGQRLLKTDAPFIAYRATTSNDFNGTTTQLKVLAAP